MVKRTGMEYDPCSGGYVYVGSEPAAVAKLRGRFLSKAARRGRLVLSARGLGIEASSDERFSLTLFALLGKLDCCTECGAHRTNVRGVCPTCEAEILASL